MSVGQLIFRQAALSLLVRVSGLAFAFVASLVLSRLVGIEQFGQYMIALGCGTIASIAIRCGFDNAALRFASVYREQQRHGALRGFFANALGAIFLAWSALIGMLILAWVLDAPFLRGFDPALLLGAAVLAIFLSILGVVSALFRTCDHLFESQFYEQMLRPAVLIFLLLATAFVGTAIDATRAMALTAASVAIATIICLARLGSDIRALPAETTDYSDRVQWFKVGSVIGMLGLLKEFFNQQEILLLGLLAGSSEAGLYAAASRLSGLAIFGVVAVTYVTGPRMAKAYHRGDLDEVASVARLTARLSVGSALLVSAGLAIAAPYILPLWGPAFSAAVPMVLISLVGGIVMAATGSAASLTLLTGHERASFLVLGATVAFSLLIEGLLIPLFGGVGAAIGSAAGVAFMNLALAFHVRRSMGIDCTILGRARVARWNASILQPT